MDRMIFTTYYHLLDFLILSKTLFILYNRHHHNLWENLNLLIYSKLDLHHLKMLFQPLYPSHLISI